MTVPMALEANNANFPTQTLVPTIASWCFVGYLWFWYRSTKIWVHCNGSIDAFTNVPGNTQRTQITTICVVSLVVVAMWPLEILFSTILWKITHATNQQGLPKVQPRTPPEEPQAPPPPPYDAVGAA